MNAVDIKVHDNVYLTDVKSGLIPPRVNRRNALSVTAISNTNWVGLIQQNDTGESIEIVVPCHYIKDGTK